MAKKTIKYLENGEYHDATVKDVGVIEELKTESKDNLVEAINEIFLGGGKGFSDLQQKVDESTQAAQNAQQAAGNLQQKLDEVAQNVGLSDEEVQKIINQAVEDAKRAQAEALQAYKDAQKELDDSMAQFMEEQKAINKELEQAKADIQGDIDQKNAEIEQINTVIESTKSDLTATSARLASVRNDLTNAQMDWGKVRTEITNINGKLDSKMSNTDFDEYKERIEHNETEITQTKNELQSKATKQDLDVLTGTVTTQGSNITQLAGKLEGKVSKDTLANDIDDFQVKKANIFTGTREFMGWEFSDKALGRVNDDSYNHAKVAEINSGAYLYITIDGLEVGKTYSVSIFAKTSKATTGGVTLVADDGKAFNGVMKGIYAPHDTKVTTDWQRYYATIVASATKMKFTFQRNNIVSDTVLYLNRPKLEVGETVYAWEDNAQDIYKRVEHTEAQFDVYNDQISGIVKRQTETDKKIENVSSTFTQRADGIEANSKKYTDDKATGLAEEFSGKLKATSQELSTEYEKQTNAKIGALSDGGSNLILNSSFLITDNNGNATLENWRDVSSKVSLATISDNGRVKGLDGTWLKSGKATSGNGTELGARTNYFPVKQGKLVVGVDVALDAMGRRYNGSISPYILRIEYYDASNNRVNYEDVTLQKLGLTENDVVRGGLFSNYKYARGVYKTSNDRSDVAKACIVVPETITGYDMYLTNFFAKFSDVNDGTYEVNPLDQQASLIKQRTKIEQDSEKINLLNTQTEKLGNDIKATNTSVSVLKGEVDLKATQSTVNDLTNRVSKNEADIRVFPDKIKSEVREVSKKIDGVNSKVDGIQIGGGKNLVRGTSSNWTGVGRDEFNGSNNQTHIIGYAYLDQLKVGDSVTVTCNYQYSGVTNANAEVQIQGWGNVDEWGPGQFPRKTPFAMQTGNDLYKGSINYTFKLTADMVKNRYWQLAWRFNYVNKGAWFQWVFFKMEKGTTATPWTPAPEDLNDSIEATKSIATQTKDGFDRLTQKTGYNASTGEFSKITTQINEGIKGVSSEVKSVSNKVDSVNGRIDSLNVGGRNLLYKTKDIDVNNKNWYQKGSNVYYDKKYDKKAIHAWGDWSTYVSNQTIHLEANTDYVVSAYLLSYQGGNGGSNGSGIQFGVYAKNIADNQGFTIGVLQNTKGNLSNTEWRRFSTVYHNTNTKDITDFRIEASGDWSTVSGNVWIAEIKLEKGNIATDYTQAPEDLQDGIDIATTKATQTDTKFERMISQIQYNDSTGEIGKYEHKITELANGTQEKISAIRTDGDKKLQSATQTLTNKIGDLERTVRTNTTSLGQYRQEMTNSAKELSLKLTSYQNLVLNDISGVKNKVDNIQVGGTNLLRNTRFSDGSNWGYTGTAHMWTQNTNKPSGVPSDNQTMDIMSTTADSRNALVQTPKVKAGETYTVSFWGKADKETYMQVESNQNTRFNQKIGTSWQKYSGQVMFQSDNRTLYIYPTTANVWVHINSLKLEKGNVPTDWSPSPEDTDNKIGILQGQITANANKFNTVYTKTDVDNKINPLNSRTEFLQDNSQFLLRVQQAGAATGGVNNLLTNSDTFDGYSENNTNSFDFQKIEGSGLPSVPNQPSITMMGHVWDNYGSAYNKNDGIYLENGETYWFGVYLMTDSNAGAFRNLSVYASSDKGQTSGSANKYFAGEVIDFNKHFGGKTKTWKWNTFKLTGDGTTRYNWRIEPYNHIGGSIWTAGYMLVKSPLPPTGWSPNMTDVQMRLDSGGVTINGNTTINGELNTQDVVLKGKSSTMALNGDGGVGIFDNAGKFGMRLTGAKLNFDLMYNNEMEKLGGIISTKNTAANNVNGIHLYVTPQQTLGKPYGGDEIGIGKQTALSGSTNIQSAMVYNATGASKEEGFHWYKPSYLETTEGRTIKVVGARDPLIWRALKWGASTQGDYYQPFLSLGYNDNTVGDSGIGFYWNSVKLAGSVDMSDARIWMKDAEANIRFGWTNWSDWTGKIPSMYRTEWGKTQSTGGIGIGGDGNVILFGGGRRWDINHRM